MAQRCVEYHGMRFEISYERIKPSVNIDSKLGGKKALILFLHGWGSNKDIMKMAFGKCFNDYEHIYMDMPGFGNSPNQTPLNTHDYAEIVKIFLNDIEDEIPLQEMLVVGHSFGGKVAVLCNPNEMILLSSAGIVLPKSLIVRCKIACAKLMKKCGLSRIGKLFRAKDVQNMNEGMYQTFKNVVNEDFTSVFSGYAGMASIFWGENDKDTPLICGQQIASLIKNNRFFALSGDHYFFLKQGSVIERLYRGEDERV